MPTLRLSSPLLKTTADGLSLAVGITHQLKLAIDDEPVLKIHKFPPPESLDILSSSSILLRLTGSFEGKEISTETLRRSSLVAYLLEYLKLHCTQLFIDDISDPYVSADGTLEFAITSSRTLLDPDELSIAAATLVAINWSFAWKSTTTEETFMNPFSSQHLLPVQNLVSSVVEKVLSRDFVRRYPLIFGSWRNYLDAEMDMFPQVVQPILNIVARSQNTIFQKKCRNILRSLRRSNNTAYDNSLDRFQGTLGSLTSDGVSTPPHRPHRDDERILLLSLQRLHRTSFRAERFKASTFITKSDDPLHNSDHCIPSSDTLFEYAGSTPFENLEDPRLDSDETMFTDLFTGSEPSQDIGNMSAPPLETIGPEETAETGHLFEGETDAFTLAGLDDGWESISLQASPIQTWQHHFLGNNDLGYRAFDLDASPTEFPTCPDIPRFCDLGTTTLEHPTLDLDSDDEMGEEEAVLDF